MNEQTIQEILKSYNRIVENTKEALVAAGVPRKEVYFYVFIPPDFDYLLPDDCLKFYKDIRSQIIIHFRKLGFSQREIARRIGGSSYDTVNKTLLAWEKREVKKNDNG